MPHPIHHIQKRKSCKNKEPYPHSNPLKALTDRLVYVVAILAPLITIAQSYDIWSTKDAGRVSLLTFSTYVIGNAVWLCYGLIHKEKPIIAMYFLALFVNSSIVLGIILYR